MTRVRRLPAPAPAPPADPSAVGLSGSDSVTATARGRRLIGWLCLFGVAFVVDPRLIALPALGHATIVVRRSQNRKRRRDASHRMFIESLPEALTLFELCAAVGLAPRHALAVFDRFAVGAVGREFAGVSRSLDAGAPLGDAIAAAREFVHEPEWRRLCAVIERGDRDSSAWPVELASVADDLQRRRLRQAEEQAHRLTVALLFPLVLFVLPAFVLMAIAPLILDAVGQLSP